MTKLSQVEAKARRMAGRLSGERRRSQAEALREVCAAHWLALRGSEPSAPLAKALWRARPALADLFVDLYSTRDPGLAAALGRLSPAQGLALLVLAEIDRGEGEEARSAYEAMTLYDLPGVGEAHARRVRARLSGHGPRVPPQHPRSSRASLWKALTAIAAETGRCDVNATVEAVALLARLQAGATEPGEDEASARVLRALESLGVTFLGIDRDRIHYQVRRTGRKPVSLQRVAEFLTEIGNAPGATE